MANVARRIRFARRGGESTTPEDGASLGRYGSNFELGGVQLTAIVSSIDPLHPRALRLSGSAGRGRGLQASFEASRGGRFLICKLYPEGCFDEDRSCTPATASRSRSQYYPFQKKKRRIRLVLLIRGMCCCCSLRSYSLRIAPNCTARRLRESRRRDEHIAMLLLTNTCSFSSFILQPAGHFLSLSTACDIQPRWT